MRRRINAPFSPNFDEIMEPYLRANMTQAILEGEHPIQAWRHQRALLPKKLAKLTGIDETRLMNLEREIEVPTEDELDKLAKALKAPRDLLVAPQDDSDELGGGDFRNTEAGAS